MSKIYKVPAVATSDLQEKSLAGVYEAMNHADAETNGIYNYALIADWAMAYLRGLDK